jgi:hypothetical protein
VSAGTQRIPSTHELIRDYGRKSNLRCSGCGGWTVYIIPAEHTQFTLCSFCDLEPGYRFR